MRILGPVLRKCGLIFGIPKVGSDMQVSLCLAWLTRKGAPIKERHHQTNGFNTVSTFNEREEITSGRQVTFHKITEDAFDVLYGAVVTPIDDDRFLDWSPIALRSLGISAGGSNRGYIGVFGNLVCLGLTETNCLEARGGIVRTEKEFANFTQQFVSDFVLYLRCNQRMEIGEIAYFSEPPPPEFGVVFEVRCPEPSFYPNRGRKAEKRVTVEDEPLL
jgi:hypothetical protein